MGVRLAAGAGMALALALLLATAQPRSTRAISIEESSLHGWEGVKRRPESRPESRPEHVLVEASTGNEEMAAPVRRRWVETIAWHPRAFVFHNFLASEEADELLYQAAPFMKRSTVVGTKANTVDNIRTSYGTFLRRLSSPMVKEVEMRLANWTQLPVINQEDIQILRYEHGQKYGAHYDSLGRVCTVLVYLTEPEEGGETAFPKTTINHWAEPRQAAQDAAFSECAKGHVAFKPKKGDALLFYSLLPDGKTQDDLSMHTGCPLISGVKWTATIWIHPDAFRGEEFRELMKRMDSPAGVYSYKPGPLPRDHDPGVCMDHHPMCANWAEHGECSANPGYMVGQNSGELGACRRACKMCEACEPADVDCYVRNRVSAGYLDLREEVKAITGRILPMQA